MKKSDLIRYAYEVDSDTGLSLFISTFLEVGDAEIAAILCAWMSNGIRGEEVVVENLINNTMGSDLQSFMHEYPKHRIFTQQGIETFFGTLTYQHLDTLCMAISRALRDYDNLYECYQAQWKEKKCKYAHQALAYAFGNGCGLPTRSSNCTFYRYNLLFYWLTYKLRLWDDANIQNALLPCNDRVLSAAYELNVLHNRAKSTLATIESLTDKARDWFGDSDFYKMFELLSFYE